jgi:hypothetical protein
MRRRAAGENARLSQAAAGASDHEDQDRQEGGGGGGPFMSPASAPGLMGGDATPGGGGGGGATPGAGGGGAAMPGAGGAGGCPFVWARAPPVRSARVKLDSNNAFMRFFLFET